MNRRLLAGLLRASPYLADAAQAVTVGLPQDRSLTWGDYVSAGIDPKRYNEAQVRQASQQITDLSSKVYEAEQNGDYNEAQKIRQQLLPIVGQYGDNTGIQQLWHSINDKWNSASEEANRFLAMQLQAANSGMQADIVEHSDMSKPGWQIPSNVVNTVRGVNKNLYLRGLPSIPGMKGSRPIQEENIGPTTSFNTSPQNSPSPAQSYFTDSNNITAQIGSPGVSDIRNSSYIKDLEQQWESLKQIVQTAPTTPLRMQAMEHMRQIILTLDQLKKDPNAMFAQLNKEFQEEEDPFLKHYQLTEKEILPTVSTSSDGKTTLTQATSRVPGELMSGKIISRLKTIEGTPEQQEGLASRMTKNQDEKRLNNVAFDLENLDNVKIIKSILQADAQGKTTHYLNPYTNTVEERPDFTIGQGWKGTIQWLKANYNPNGIMQQMGGDPSDPRYTVVNKMIMLINDNNQRRASGQQTAELEAVRFAKIFLDQLGSGDANQLWSSIYHTNNESLKKLHQGFASLRDNTYIPAEYRYQAMQYGIKDPYKTDWSSYAAQPPDTTNLPTQEFSSKNLSDEDFALIHRLMTEEGPFLKIKDEKKRMQAVKQYLIELKTQPPSVEQ